MADRERFCFQIQRSKSKVLRWLSKLSQELDSWSFCLSLLMLLSTVLWRPFGFLENFMLADGWDCLATAYYDMEVHKFQYNLCNFAVCSLNYFYLMPLHTALTGA